MASETFPCLRSCRPGPNRRVSQRSMRCWQSANSAMQSAPLSSATSTSGPIGVSIVSEIRACVSELPCIVKDDPDGMAKAGAQAADAVAQVYTVVALGALHWAVVDRKGNGIALP